MKKLVIAISISAMIFGSFSSSSAAVKADLSKPFQGINITEGYRFITSPPALMGATVIGPDRIMTLCTSLTDNACTAGTAISMINHLPPCSPEIEVNCISSIYATDEVGVKTEGKFVKFSTTNTVYDYPANEKNNLPQGKSQGGIWQIPGITHAGGNDFYFASTLINGWLIKNAGVEVTNEKFDFNSIESAISPVKEISGSFNQAFPVDSSNPSRDGSKSGGVGAGIDLITAEQNSCIMMGAGICYSIQDFPKEIRFGMRIVLGKNMKGWFHGRIFQPVIDVQTSGSKQTITFEALPVKVPTLYERVSTSLIDSEFRTYLSGNRTFSEGSGYFIPGNSGQEAFEMAGFWLPLIRDKATTSRSYWNVKTLLGNQDVNVSRCSANDGKLAGIVTTNSLVYSAGPPTYNRAEESLDYKVLSPHYTATGEEAIGSYDLILRSDVARCIYGFSKAPIQAVVSIISPEGENKVATTLIREKDGWLTLSAVGFTFSSPTIRVVLSQKAVASSVSSSKRTSKTTTINCVKGSTLRKVSGIKPKCPTGYKKR